MESLTLMCPLLPPTITFNMQYSPYVSLLCIHSQLRGPWLPFPCLFPRRVRLPLRMTILGVSILRCSVSYRDFNRPSSLRDDENDKQT